MGKFTEEEVHQHLFATGLEAVVLDAPEFEVEEDAETGADIGFSLWRVIKARAFDKLERLHESIRYGAFAGSKVKLPIDKTRPMELDLLGHHSDGLFVLELKVERSAERNAFSELLGYSYYIAEMFALSGPQDITNVLVANLDAKITRQAFLYDLLVADRNILVYQPELSGETLQSLKLRLHVPTDDDFRMFANRLLSHEAMACVAISFHDLNGWIDSKEEGGSLNAWTRAHLEGVAGYAAQLMEAEGLHGFCFIRKPWEEIPTHYRNTLFVCALNPFRVARPDRRGDLSEQLVEEEREAFFDAPSYAFDGRLIRLVQRTVKDTLTHYYDSEVETADWGAIVTSMTEVVFTHNFGFRPTGVLREAYVAYLTALYAREAIGKGYGEDVSTLKINEITNWLHAWSFMEMCGFIAGEAEGTEPSD